MGVRILFGTYDGGDFRAVYADSVSETAFGPLFENYDEAVFEVAAGRPAAIQPE